MSRHLLLTACLAFLLAACGRTENGPAGGDTLTVASQPPDTADILTEPLTPATLRDPRIEELGDAERRILQDYVNRGIRRDSLEHPESPNTLGGWLDSNLTVGEVIALYRNTQKIEPLPPEHPVPQAPVEGLDEQE